MSDSIEPEYQTRTGAETGSVKVTVEPHWPRRLSGADFTNVKSIDTLDKWTRFVAAKDEVTLRFAGASVDPP